MKLSAKWLTALNGSTPADLKNSPHTPRAGPRSSPRNFATSIGHEKRSSKPAIAIIGEGDTAWSLAKYLLRERVNVTRLLTPKPGDISPLEKIAVSGFSGAHDLSSTMQLSGGQYFVVASLGMKIPSAIVEQYKGRLFNVHASKLPAYAGVADPIKAMMANGETIGWVTIHEVSNKLDGGRIVAQASYLMSDSPDKNVALRLNYLKALSEAAIQLNIFTSNSRRSLEKSLG